MSASQSRSDSQALIQTAEEEVAAGQVPGLAGFDPISSMKLHVARHSSSSSWHHSEHSTAWMLSVCVLLFVNMSVCVLCVNMCMCCKCVNRCYA